MAIDYAKQIYHDYEKALRKLDNVMDKLSNIERWIAKVKEHLIQLNNDVLKNIKITKLEKLWNILIQQKTAIVFDGFSASIMSNKASWMKDINKSLGVGAIGLFIFF